LNVKEFQTLLHRRYGIDVAFSGLDRHVLISVKNNENDKLQPPVDVESLNVSTDLIKEIYIKEHIKKVVEFFKKKGITLRELPDQASLSLETGDIEGFNRVLTDLAIEDKPVDGLLGINFIRVIYKALKKKNTRRKRGKAVK